ncbi:CaiB/BaiF CoA transferase family protein [Rhodovarius lipocyclicus]|uniref:CaiB/BaiF CoA transferase family protein n=1 Tax=Rhodovarius lipocyclicus TaxID=268410 RepID=UPI00135A0369|nr:CoA transferase [Rhodovarius lipocyclicus]
MLPLEGIRVIEFSHMVMGPTCGLILADLGAEVIKVEPPGGDRTRALTASGAGFFPALSRNKKSVVLDTATERDREALLELTDNADVVIENFRPGALDERGIGFETLRARNPRLVCLSLKGFLPGPYEKRTALDEVVQMMAGLAYMTGPPGRPLRAGAPVNDMMGGMFGAIAVMGALMERAKTGQGQVVQSALFETCTFLVSTAMMQKAITGQEPPPMPGGRRAWGVYDIFTASDGVQIFVGVVTDRQWQIFAEALGRPELLTPEFGSNSARSAAREKLIPMVQEMLGQLPVAAIEALCEKGGLPFARINKPWDLLEDRHLVESGGFLDVHLTDGTPTRVPALPIMLGERRLGLRLDLPQVGEHNKEILGRDPGLEAAE